jgi:UDP-N-acetylmuramyl pentapeptide phosphotransferase/UDP-N-acetylglucosamine-1-phosphate transferase
MYWQARGYLFQCSTEWHVSNLVHGLQGRTDIFDGIVSAPVRKEGWNETKVVVRLWIVSIILGF